MASDYENVKVDYTPTTQEVRDVWGKHSRYMEFDDWLASVKAEAWDEGHMTPRELEQWNGHVFKAVNPYREVSK